MLSVAVGDQRRVVGVRVAGAERRFDAVVSTIPLPFAGIRLVDHDVTAASAAVRALWDDPERCRRDGEANRQTALRYDWPAHAVKLEEVYRRILDRHALAA